MMKHIVSLGLMLALIPEQIQTKNALIDSSQHDGMQPITACATAELAPIYLVLNSFEDVIITLRLAPKLHAQGKELYIQAPHYLQQLLQMSEHITLVNTCDTRNATCSLDELLLLVAQDRHNKNESRSYLVIDQLLKQIWHDLFTMYEQLKHGSIDTSNFFYHLKERLATWSELNDHDIITTEVQIGELIDKMTILEIKMERICDEQKLVNIGRELSSVRATFDTYIPQSAELNQLIHELKSANEALWETEDLIRDKEREKSFDDDFIRLARSVYIQNDERCRAKRAINELLGSRLVEEKSYKPYN